MPPYYSPFFNIVENAISSLKAAIKRNLATPEMMQELLNPDHGINLQAHRWNILSREVDASIHGAITAENSRNWFQHTMRNIPRALNLEDIQE